VHQEEGQIKADEDRRALLTIRDARLKASQSIPSRSNRKQPFSFSKHLYKLRCRIQQIEGLQAYRNAI
jgi:hypothetical protein